jgi:predicted dienelactone hydrolase
MRTSLFRTTLAALLLAAAAHTVHAGVGLMTLPGQQGDRPVTVFYPTAQAERGVQRGPFTLSLAEQALPVRGNGRLVVMSHGSGGNPWVHSNLARALVNAGFVVAVPEHDADSSRDPSQPGPESWKKRPAEVSRAIDAVGQAPALASLLALDRVGMYGMSAGGHTALSFAGGRWSPAQFRRHCEQHLADDFAACVGLATALRGNVLDDAKLAVALAIIRNRFQDERWYAHDEPRVRAVVTSVPWAADFDAASLAAPRVPLGFVTAAQDKWLAPRFHSSAVLEACKPRCELLADLPTGGHGALLSPPPPIERLGAIAADLIGDPPGFDRSALPAVDERIVAFFRQHLLP